MLKGPVVEVQVEVPQALAAALSALGQPIPAPVQGLALIDTGASVSAVDVTVIQQLGVQQVGQVSLATPTGAQPRQTFPGRFTFPSGNIPPMDFQTLVGADLIQQGIAGTNTPFIALIGRDILCHFVLVYNGLDGSFSLAF